MCVVVKEKCLRTLAGTRNRSEGTKEDAETQSSIFATSPGLSYRIRTAIVFQMMGSSWARYTSVALNVSMSSKENLGLTISFIPSGQPSTDISNT